MSEQRKLFPNTPVEADLAFRKSIVLGEAKELAEKIALVEVCYDDLKIVGSMRRQRAIVNDIDFVVISGEWQNLGNALISKLKAKQIMKGDKIKRFLVPTEQGVVQADFYRATIENMGALILIRTGSAEHNIWLAKRAIKQGKRLLYSVGLVKGGKVIAGRTEEGMFEALGLEYINPVNREIGVDGNPVWWKK